MKGAAVKKYQPSNSAVTDVTSAIGDTHMKCKAEHMRLIGSVEKAECNCFMGQLLRYPSVPCELKGTAISVLMVWLKRSQNYLECDYTICFVFKSNTW